MNRMFDVRKKRSPAIKLAALLAGYLVTAGAYATDTFTATYNIGPLGAIPYINTPTVTGTFSDKYNFSIASSSSTAGTAVTIDLVLGENYGYHITGLDLDLFNSSHAWLDGDMVTGADDASVSLSETLAAGNYYFRVRGVADGATTNQGIYTFTAAAIPEAKTYAMMLAGLGLIGFTVVRRRSI